MGPTRSTSTQPSYNLLTGDTGAPAGSVQRQTRPQNRRNGSQATSTRLARPSARLGTAAATGSTAGSAAGSAAGDESRQTSSYVAATRESSKENMAPPDAGAYEAQRRRIEELKAEVGTLRYQVSTYEQEREMGRLQHEAELREARRKAEADFKQRQAAEGERAAATRQTETLQNELATLRGEEEGRRAELERRQRETLDEAQVLREQLEELHSTTTAAARMHERRTAELEGQVAAAQRTASALESAAEEREQTLAQMQAALAEREDLVGRLETDVLRLKAQTGDAATMEIIRRELKDQVSHIRALEATNREQLAELRHLRQTRRAVEVVEEEKRTLQRRFDGMAALEQELAEERIQRERLEAEHRAWAAFLDQDGCDFDSPEALAKALMEERFRTAALTEKIGAVEPEVAQRDADLQVLRAEKDGLAAELERVKQAMVAASGATTAAAAATPTTTAAAAAADKARARLERQRVLAVKEVEYLRTQLRAFDAEDVTFHPEQFDRQKAERIEQLEQLVDQYRVEADGLHKALEAAEQGSREAGSSVDVGGVKRARPVDDADENNSNSANNTNEQLGQLARRARKLQDELAAARTAQRTAEAELDVTREQLAGVRKTAGVRVLALRANPTAEHEAVKQATLEALRQENADLLSHVTGQKAKTPFSTVPLSVLAAGQREIAAAQTDAASAHKTARRLKEVWAAKSAEFKEAVESTLGWHVTFIPNGKMRVESAFCPSTTDEHENSIVFDGERGTMKVGGGPRSPFARRIDDQIRFWVREKGCIPGFLAALTLEFCEEQARQGNGST
ncbi:m protein repeat protein [Grosmannia clavigera kw1407]|uniref:Spindle assembly checkpoint component MAD1 n=1 Tax=Grosmannia clavigera (strain kw1407 / UAMH 11150) TaxID=655863 RepID=F0X828_GROCL|nr:m protein repeat protein [Grosmannia clavigera kw1407]EFX05370.1 m protein repeat protein [Grosmannia clavigera kw1407]